MSEGRRKKSVNGGGAPAQTNPDDRRSTLPEAEAAGKRAVIKSADMKEDMQKEAIEIAITVHYPLPLSLYIYIYIHSSILGDWISLSICV